MTTVDRQHIEALSGRCRNLAFALTEHADQRTFLRAVERRVIRRFAEQLLDIANELTVASEARDHEAVTRLTRWARRIALPLAMSALITGSMEGAAQTTIQSHLERPSVSPVDVELDDPVVTNCAVEVILVSAGLLGTDVAVPEGGNPTPRAPQWMQKAGLEWMYRLSLGIVRPLRPGQRLP